MNNKQNTKFMFPINHDGSVGCGSEISIVNSRETLQYGDIIVRIAPEATRSYMARHNDSGISIWEIDLDNGGGSFEFYIWEKKGHMKVDYDEFFAWLQEAYPADYQFVMFNMEFFDNRFALA